MYSTFSTVKLNLDSDVTIVVYIQHSCDNTEVRDINI